MLKWLLITIIVVIGFMIALLGLGYLLKENEKATTALKQQLDQQAQHQRNKKSKRAVLIIPTTDEGLPLTDASAKNDSAERIIVQFQNIVIKNLTCVSQAQCVVANVSFANVNCHVAINSIGASLLAKLNTQDKTIDNCPMFSAEKVLRCQQNACTLH